MNPGITKIKRFLDLLKSSQVLATNRWNMKKIIPVCFDFYLLDWWKFEIHGVGSAGMVIGQRGHHFGK